MIPPTKTALNYALATVRGMTNPRFYETKTSGCPCVLFEHNGVTYSIVYFLKWRTYTIFDNFGTPNNSKVASKITKFALAETIRRIKES